MEDDQTGDESFYSVSPLVISGVSLSLSDLEKAEALADSLEAQFQPMTVPSLPAVIDNHINVNHDVALRSYFLTPASERKLTNPDEVHEAIRGLKVVKAPGPNGIPNRALKYLPPASVIPPRPDFYRGSPHPSLSNSVEARSSDLHL